MTHPFVARVGGILSGDIAVPDHEREVCFYADVLGTGDHPLWRKDLMNSDGLPIIGVGARSPEYADLPLQWMPHIQVADVALSAARALEMGGRELLHGKNADGTSQWAVILDPNGAAFGMIPLLSEEMLRPMEKAASKDAKPVGCIAWVELTVDNAVPTRDFYQSVIGWSVQETQRETEENTTDYVMLGNDGRPAVGIRHAHDSVVPPIWMLHLPVGDLAESLRRVQEGGGKIIARHKAAYSDTVAVVEDPVGAVFALVPA